MTKMTLAALAMCCTTALGACPESEGKADVQEVQIQKVSNDTKSDCAVACDGKSAVQTVANETKSDCTKSCDGSGAAVQQVSNETKSDCSKSCDGAAQSVTQTVAYGGGDECSKACPLETAMPVMLMKVGNEKTACTETASKMCDKTGATMSYVVNDAEFHCPVEAKEAHETAMVAYLDSLTHVSYSVGGECMECPVGAAMACEKSGEAMKYRVGPVVFDKAEDAVRAAAMARGMAQQVAMTYEVAGEATSCSMHANEMASTCESKNVAYVINGKTTECSKTAEYNLTEAKLMAAINGIRQSVSMG